MLALFKHYTRVVFFLLPFFRFICKVSVSDLRSILYSRSTRHRVQTNSGCNRVDHKLCRTCIADKKPSLVKFSGHKHIARKMFPPRFSLSPIVGLPPRIKVLYLLRTSSLRILPSIRPADSAQAEPKRAKGGQRAISDGSIVEEENSSAAIPDTRCK